MTFTQLFSGGSRLGYYSAYGQRPLARTAALSGGAIDGFILGDSDSMSFLVPAGAWKGAIWSWGYLKSLHNRKLGSYPQVFKHILGYDMLEEPRLSQKISEKNAAFRF